MGRTYTCDNCGAEFERLTTWNEASEYPFENLWTIHFSRASERSKIYVPFKEICTVCREKLEKIIKEGF